MQKAKVTLVRFWLKKAQHNLAAARKLAQDLPDIAIYHCQQGAEKALKGFLVLHDLDPGSTHNINTLVTEAAKIAPEFKVGLSGAGLLSQYNQAYRYPGDPTEDFNPSPVELSKAFSLALQVYQSVLQAMPAEIVGQQQSPESQQEQSSSENLEL